MSPNPIMIYGAGTPGFSPGEERRLPEAMFKTPADCRRLTPLLRLTGGAVHEYQGAD